MAAILNGRILGRLQYGGPDARTAPAILDPEHLNGKPTESEFGDQAFNQPAVPITNERIKSAKWRVTEKGSVVLFEPTSDHMASFRLISTLRPRP